MEKDTLAKALGKVPSGLYVVTVRKDAEVAAFLGSWVMQAGFEPPMITVAVKTGRPAQPLLDADAAFAVNIIPAGPGSLLRHFARGFAPGEDPYAGLSVERGENGVEVLPDALAVLECRVAGALRGGDHNVYLGEVTAARFREGAGTPAVHIRKNGLDY